MEEATSGISLPIFYVFKTDYRFANFIKVSLMLKYYFLRTKTTNI